MNIPKTKILVKQIEVFEIDFTDRINKYLLLLGQKFTYKIQK